MELWIARDEDGGLWAYSTEVEKHDYRGSYLEGDGVYYPKNVDPDCLLKIPDSLFPEVTWESGPRRVRLVLEDE